MYWELLSICCLSRFPFDLSPHPDRQPWGRDERPKVQCWGQGFRDEKALIELLPHYISANQRVQCSWATRYTVQCTAGKDKKDENRWIECGTKKQQNMFPCNNIVMARSHCAVASCLLGMGGGEDAGWCKVSHASVIISNYVRLTSTSHKGLDTHANNSCRLMALRELQLLQAAATAL